MKPEGTGIDVAITNIEEQLKRSDLKWTLADYIKLLQLRKDRDDDAPKQITVRWVETWAQTPATEQ